MATAPSFISYTDTGWATTNSTASVSTGSISVASGDRLVAVGSTSDQALTLAVAGGSLTWTLAQSVVVSSYCTVYAWTTTATSTTSFQVTFTRSGTSTTKYGGGVYVFRDSDGFGASSKTNVSSGAPSLALTTTADNSAVIALTADWSAADGASRTWRTINSVTPTAGNGYEKAYYRDSNQYTVYSACWPDAGSAGSKTTGLSAPTGQKYAICALEIKGTTSGSTYNESGVGGGLGSTLVSFPVTFNPTPLGGGLGSSLAANLVSFAPSVFGGGLGGGLDAPSLVTTAAGFGGGVGSGLPDSSAVFNPAPLGGGLGGSLSTAAAVYAGGSFGGGIGGGQRGESLTFSPSPFGGGLGSSLASAQTVYTPAPYGGGIGGGLDAPAVTTTVTVSGGGLGGGQIATGNVYTVTVSGGGLGSGLSTAPLTFGPVPFGGGLGAGQVSALMTFNPAPFGGGVGGSLSTAAAVYTAAPFGGGLASGLGSYGAGGIYYVEPTSGGMALGDQGTMVQDVTAYPDGGQSYGGSASWTCTTASVYDAATLRAALLLWWSGRPDLHALTSDAKLWHIEAPEDTALPYLTYALTEAAEQARTTAYYFLAPAIQFTAHATTDRQAAQIRNAVRKAIRRAPLLVRGNPVWYCLPGSQGLELGEGRGPNGSDCWMATLDVDIPWQHDFHR